MNSFAAALDSYDTDATLGQTANGMPALASSTDALVDLFFVIGSSRSQDISAKFDAAFAQDPLRALKILFWARDVRGGSGERETFRRLMRHLAAARPDTVISLLGVVAEYGRWDDLLVFEQPRVASAALSVYADALRRGDGLASKWAPRKGPVANALRKTLGLDPKGYRRLVVGLTRVVETQMCARDWVGINYEHVPSLAASRYAKAFNRHDTERYSAYKAAAVAGEARINAGAVFPYDVIRNARMGDETTALAQWQALPNLLGDDHILPMVDVSGSMSALVGSQRGAGLSCLDVALSLGLYLADKQTGAFQDMILTFSARSKICKLEGNLLAKLHQLQSSEWGMNTSLESAFREILRVAVVGQVPAEEMPKHLLVLTDLGFDACQENANQGAFDMAREMFSRAGYTLPNVVWWNIAHRSGGYGGDRNTPVAAGTNGTALVSGFSPSIVRSVLSAKSVTPRDIMLEAIDGPRYDKVGSVVQL